MNRSIILSIVSACLFTACSSDDQTDFLEGEWKREDKELYEVWEKSTDGSLDGHSYRMEDQEKKITETLTIKKINDQYVLEATVPDQNDGKTVPFILNASITDYLSFENPDHDFPKKIQYKNLGNDRIQVTVLGENDEGFTYVQIKQQQ